MSPATMIEPSQWVAKPRRRQYTFTKERGIARSTSQILGRFCALCDLALEDNQSIRCEYCLQEQQNKSVHISDNLEFLTAAAPLIREIIRKSHKYEYCDPTEENGESRRYDYG